MTRPVVGIGEVLWDVFPDGRRVAGGAPFNFAFHCHQLGHAGTVVSRVGDDELGRELRAEVRRLGMSDAFIQVDPERPTGTVQVALDAGQPSYRITENVAWDAIAWTPALAALAGGAAAVCHGTLAQRADASGETIQTFLHECRGALRVLDVNFRQRYYTRERLSWSLFRSRTVKLNADELPVLAELFGWPGDTDAERVAELFRFSAGETRLVILTRGADGATVYPERGESLTMPAPPANVVDAVGAGDAFTAAMVCLALEQRSPDDTLRFALHYAARVCEHRGATPTIDRAEVERAGRLQPESAVLTLPDPTWRPPTLDTPRLVLRPFEDADAEPLFPLAANPAVTRFTLWDAHRSLADTRMFVCDYARGRYAEGVPEPLAVCLNADPRRWPAGAVGVFWASQPNRVMELGYWLGEPFWGAGYAAEACRAVVAHAFAAFDVERIQARVIVGNDASARVLEKVRFREEGTARGVLYRRGRQEDVRVFAAVRGEWGG